MLKHLRKTNKQTNKQTNKKPHTNQLGIGFMNPCTYKPTQEIGIYIMG